MKNKIKTLLKQHKEAVIGFGVGCVVTGFLINKGLNNLQDEGYRIVRPLGYDEAGVLHVQMPNGRTLHARKEA